jgi:hypothetical protein
MDKDKKQERFFNRGQKIFWALILLIVLLPILHLSDGLFDGKNIPRFIVNLETEDEEIEIEEDEDKENEEIEDISDIGEDKYLDWTWIDFNGDRQKIKFKYKDGYLSSSTKNRENSFDYGKLYRHDRVLLADLIDKMQLSIKNQDLDYLGAIEYVCSSIQHIPYTLILSSQGIEYPVNSGRFVKCPCQTNFGFYKNDCNARNNADGCCNNVDPFGVYAPFEFVYKKTGDCDTRALLAFTILKEMGFDVAVMVSRKESHSVLGVYLPSRNGLSFGKNNFGKKYILWELTNDKWRLGMKVPGNDWKADLE